jgi:hypothetical protein
LAHLFLQHALPKRSREAVWLRRVPPQFKPDLSSSSLITRLQTCFASRMAYILRQ